jgi:hypothetical protein
MLGQQNGILVVKVGYFMDSRVTWTYKKIKKVYVLNPFGLSAPTLGLPSLWCEWSNSNFLHNCK